jgi:recombination protein RecT
VVLAASLGLEFNNALGQGYLIPYKGVCTFQPGYRGLITLALRSGRVHDVSAQMVLHQDNFEFEYGTNEFLRHRPARRGMDVNPEKDWDCAYALVRYKEGPTSFLVLDRAEIERVRNQSSQSWQHGRSPWQTNFEEMVRKTPTKRHLKYCDLSAHLSQAVGMDDQAEAGMAQDNIIDWGDYRDLTPGVEHEPKVVRGYTPGADAPQQEVNGQAKGDDGPPETLWSDNEAGSGAADDTLGPFTQDMFSPKEWEAALRNFEAAGLGKTAAQLGAYFGRSTKKKGEALRELEAAARKI